MRRLLLLLCLLPLVGAAQSEYTWDDFVQMVAEDDGETDDGAATAWAEQMEELKGIAESPIDWATATRHDLERLPFLTPEQVEALVAYAYLHRPVRSLAELRLIPEIDYDVRQALTLFLRTDSTQAPPDRRLKIGRLKHQIDTRLDIPLYYRKAYSVKNGYAGDPLYHRIRYTLTDKRHLQAGARIEKDPGERFYDSWGAYAMLRDVGAVDRLVVGDYRVGFGEGLVMGGSSWMSKSVLRMRPATGIRPMTGMDEGNFLRGAAATLRLSPTLSLTAFASFRKLDATLADSAHAQTIVTSGLHRTKAERDKRRDLKSYAAGGDLSWTHRRTVLGLSGVFQGYDLPFAVSDKPYRRYYPVGNRFGAMGLHYATAAYRWFFQGEAALSTGRKGFATTHRITWLASDRWRLSASGRYYTHGYFSPYARATSESGGVRNELGGTLRCEAQSLWGFNLTAYLDLFYNQWPRYQMTESSAGQDLMVQLTRPLGRRHTLLLRYQLKRKAASDVMLTHHRAKLQWTYTPSKVLRSQTTLVTHSVSGRTGLALGESLKGAWRSDRWRATLTAAYFYTPDYATRVYIYQPSLLSTVATGQLYGHGLSLSATARWTAPSRRFLLEALVRTLRYFDRSTQGTGLQTIYSAWKSDISVQAVVKI